MEKVDPALRNKLLAHIDTIVRNDEDIELAYAQKCVDDLAATPIPADIAQKLGIEPEEG